MNNSSSSPGGRAGSWRRRRQAVLDDEPSLTPSDDRRTRQRIGRRAGERRHDPSFGGFGGLVEHRFGARVADGRAFMLKMETSRAGLAAERTS